mmetsp:Transcript_9078/g.6425  ORF Transcript_9078/g.6425 Transcript_9078/m.6425 type:complete len:111 (+) Transcript_9078:1436-1768(+)
MRETIHTQKIKSCCFCNDENMAVTAAKDGYIKIWDIQRKQQASEFYHTSVVRSLVDHEENSFVLAGHSDGYLRLWNPVQKQMSQETLIHSAPIKQIRYLSYTSNYIITTS